MAARCADLLAAGCTRSPTADLDGQLHLLLEDEYKQVVREKRTLMPAFDGTPRQYLDLVAFLSILGGVPVGPNPAALESVMQSTIEQVLAIDFFILTD